MFWKMLKSDLLLKKGLNMILFIFITAASAIVFTSACQFYAQITGESRSAETCLIPDLKIMINSGTADRQRTREETAAILEKDSEVTGFSRCEAVFLNPSQVDFNDFEERDQDSFFESVHYLTRLPHDRDLVYDLNDKPFYVENGTIAISIKVRDITGAKIGDKLKIVTDMGRIYELRIARFFKENYSSGTYRYIISDADYEVIVQDYPTITDIYCINLETPSNDDFARIDGELTEKDIKTDHYILLNSYYNSEALISFIITSFMIVISVFFIIIILMTLRFTIISALKEEEKEIGMMRAIGVDSLKFRWMFAAKYIAFSVVGGIIGSVIGIPVSRLSMSMFCRSFITPETEKLIIAGGTAVSFTAVIMIIFCISVMRRINKISVVDAIHGENHGERFGRGSVIKLHRRRRMSVPFFLGLSDVLSRAKRYIFLVLSFTLGGFIILISSYLYNSVLSDEFMN